ncbi:MAG TPA: ABC transporter substrate-binding protein [Stellaceae bacterium]|nr:ABC transporter substrate-binding protein [Stellaceae bacterium]
MRATRLLSVVGLALAALSIGAAAQTPTRIYRVGFLTIGSRGSPLVAATKARLARALADRGYALGTNLAITSRFAEAHRERLPALAGELLHSRVDVILAQGFLAARAAKDATTAVPIVVSDAGDPVEEGLVASFSRPGGNITGISDMSAELSAKRLELLKESVPGLKQVAVLWDTDDLGMTARFAAARSAASTLGLAVQSLFVRDQVDFDAAFAEMSRNRPDGIFTVTDVLTILSWRRLFEFAAAHRLPAIYEFGFLARDGGLMSYGPDGKETTRRAADLIDRIFKGARPADLPFEQPARFRFVINLKTAKALGLAMPQQLLLRADEVIE